MTFFPSQVLSSRTKDLDALRAEFAAKSGDLSAKHAQEITAERERALQVIHVVTFYIF